MWLHIMLRAFKQQFNRSEAMDDEAIMHNECSSSELDHVTASLRWQKMGEEIRKALATKQKRNAIGRCY